MFDCAEFKTFEIVLPLSLLFDLKKNLHPRVKVDQACRPLPPKKNLAF